MNPLYLYVSSIVLSVGLLGLGVLVAYRHAKSLREREGREFARLADIGARHAGLSRLCTLAEQRGDIAECKRLIAAMREVEREIYRPKP